MSTNKRDLYQATNRLPKVSNITSNFKHFAISRFVRTA